MHRLRYRVLLLIHLGMLCSGVSGSPHQRMGTVMCPPPSLCQLATFLPQELVQLHIPGVALSVVSQNQVLYARGFGNADVSGRLMTAETPVVLGSVTKSFTALAVLQLVEQGKPALDVPVQHYLPWFHTADTTASAHMTTREVLNQTKRGWHATAKPHLYTTKESRGSSMNNKKVTRIVHLVGVMTALVALTGCLTTASNVPSFLTSDSLTRIDVMNTQTGQKGEASRDRDNMNELLNMLHLGDSTADTREKASEPTASMYTIIASTQQGVAWTVRVPGTTQSSRVYIRDTVHPEKSGFYQLQQPIMSNDLTQFIHKYPAREDLSIGECCGWHPDTLARTWRFWCRPTALE